MYVLDERRKKWDEATENISVGYSESTKLIGFMTLSRRSCTCLEMWFSGSCSVTTDSPASAGVIPKVLDDHFIGFPVDEDDWPAVKRAKKRALQQPESSMGEPASEPSTGEQPELSTTQNALGTWPYTSNGTPDRPPVAEAPQGAPKKALSRDFVDCRPISRSGGSWERELVYRAVLLEVDLNSDQARQMVALIVRLD